MLNTRPGPFTRTKTFWVAKVAVIDRRSSSRTSVQGAASRQSSSLQTGKGAANGDAVSVTTRPGREERADDASALVAVTGLSAGLSHLRIRHRGGDRPPPPLATTSSSAAGRKAASTLRLTGREHIDAAAQGIARHLRAAEPPARFVHRVALLLRDTEAVAGCRRRNQRDVVVGGERRGARAGQSSPAGHSSRGRGRRTRSRRSLARAPQSGPPSGRRKGRGTELAMRRGPEPGWASGCARQNACARVGGRGTQRAFFG